jgi:hypothetical protein
LIREFTLPPINFISAVEEEEDDADLYTVHEANWKPQFLEWLTYFKSIVVTIVVFERKKKTI